VKKSPASKSESPNAKRLAFLRAFAKTGTITAAARAAKSTRQKHYEWLRDDPEYAALYEAAKDEFVESVESTVHALALSGHPILLMFLLKRHKPEYRDQHKVELGGPGGGPLEVTVRFVSPEK